MRPQLLLGLSLIAHGGLALLVGTVRTRAPSREVTVITMAEPPKPKPKAPKAEPPPETAKTDSGPRSSKPSAAPKAAAAKAASTPAKAAAGPAGGGSDLPDFGLSLGGDGPGLGVSAPSGGGGDAQPREGSKTKTTPLQKPTEKPKDDCEEAVVKPVALRLPQPSYPGGAGPDRPEGKVRVEIQVDESGNVTGVRVISGMGGAFDAAALAAARTASFKPATRCGKPVRSPFVVGIRFSP